MRFVWKLFAGMTLVVGATAFVADVQVSATVEKSRLEVVRDRSREAAWFLSELVRPMLAADDIAAVRDLTVRLERRLAGRRITIIAPDGRVLADSHEDPAVMENHADRPEVLAPGSVHRRISDTLGRPMTYVAEPVESDGRLLGHARVALDASALESSGGLLRQALLTATFVALGVGLLLSWLISVRISRPLERIGAAISGLGMGDYQQRVAMSGPEEIRRVASMLNDVGDRLRRREARIVAEVGQKAAILSAMDEGLVALDRGGHVVLLNDAGRSILDRNATEGVGAHLGELTQESELLAAADSCLAEGQRREGEIRSAVADAPAVVHYVATPVLDPSGAAEMAVLVLRDVTALRRLEQVRRDFVANVSHELKTPLTTMRGYLEAVLDEPAMPAEQRRSFLEKAGRSTARLAAIVSDLLDLARLERGPEELGSDPIDMDSLAADCVRAVKADAEERRVRIEMHVPEAHTVVRGDDQSLVTAVTNLLDNAVKYSPEGGLVTVRLVQHDGQAWLTVSDQGPGIPPQEQERIFERFYRVDKDRSRQLGGTGLGLSIVKNVVLAHGGEVWVESTLGEGSQFHLRLPLLAED